MNRPVVRSLLFILAGGLLVMAYKEGGPVARAIVSGYLIAILFWIQLPLGAMAISFISVLTGGGWAQDIRPELKRLIAMIPFACGSLLPILIFKNVIFPWATMPLAGSHAIYFNPIFFGARFLIYLLIWLGLGFLAVKKSKAQLNSVAAPSLILLAFTMSFASFDWLMSLEDPWYSTVFGLLFIATSFLSSMATAIFLRSRRVADPCPAGIARDQGNILLAFVMVWAYLSFTQYLIIWSGNLPREASFYIHRSAGLWLWITAVLMLGQFGIPFFLLLFRKLKDGHRQLGSIAFLIVAMSILHVAWLVAPSIRAGDNPLNVWDAVCLILLIGIAYPWVKGNRHELR